ncbi:hypothetical protein GCM10027093_12880 [Paraburkholderia jirisanensis]
MLVRVWLSDRFAHIGFSGGGPFVRLQADVQVALTDTVDKDGWSYAARDRRGLTRSYERLEFAASKRLAADVLTRAARQPSVPYLGLPRCG